MEANQTRQQAHEQIVLHGKVGSLAGKPSTTYLYALREFTYAWIEDIEAEIDKALKREAAEADATMGSCSCDYCEEHGPCADPNH